MKSLRTLSIVIPVFNEEHTIEATLKRVKESDSLRLKKDIIVVDDASTDNTVKILNKIKGITVLTHNKNKGKGAAIKTGFLAAKGDVVLIQDADEEYSPADYPVLLEPFFTSDADVVYGSRFRGSESRRVLYFSHQLANTFLTFLSNVCTNLNVSDMECGYKVFKHDIIEAIAPKLVSQRFGIEPELTARIAKIKQLKLYEVGIHYQGRTYEEGKKIGFIDGIKALYEIVYFNFFTE